MGVLDGLKPEKVFYYFEEITKIPHGSGNVDRISDYLVKFAKDRGLKVIQDEVKNVIIMKDATEGYENEPTMILQGHMDMVAVSVPGSDIDMKKDGLRLGIDGDNIYAEGTSLGGDDGIAVAYALAILDSEDISHPALEVIITVDEEVGMDGARAIDLSMLKGHRMLNLDSEEEGYFLTSCAGGARVNCKINVERENKSGYVLEVKIGGLLGGHSGEEIIRGRGNSNCLFGRILKNITDNVEVNLISIQGGLADNAIPRETIFGLMVDEDKIGCVKEILEHSAMKIKDEYASKDPGFCVEVTEQGEKTLEALTKESTSKVAEFIVALPNGVQAMSGDVEGLVETSLNLGILSLDNAEILAEFSVRSSIGSAKEALIDKLASLVNLAGGSYEVSGDYPGWKYRVNSPLRDKMVELYKDMYGASPKLLAIHAGLECGLLADKIEDLDCVSIGPNMKDIHTTEETLSISSTVRVWEFLVALLAKKENA